MSSCAFAEFDLPFVWDNVACVTNDGIEITIGKAPGSSPFLTAQIVDGEEDRATRDRFNRMLASLAGCEEVGIRKGTGESLLYVWGDLSKAVTQIAKSGVIASGSDTPLREAIAYATRPAANHSSYALRVSAGPGNF